MSAMFVRKRNGRLQEVSFDKILIRLQRLCHGLDPEHVKPVQLAQVVIAGLCDGITTSELDVLAAESAASKVFKHNDFGVLAARIVISNLHRETSKSFSETAKLLHKCVDKTERPTPLITDKVMELIAQNAAQFDSWIVHARDYELSYFGYKTLERAYLLRVGGKIVERPQYLYMRVAICIHGNDLPKVRETYDMLSQGYFTHATPTMTNACTPRGQLSSCYLLNMRDDSIEGIYDTVKQTAQISKGGGGIGLSISNIRASGTYIAGTNGHSNGLVPMIQVLNSTARYVDQGGNKRPGAFALYLEPWHADIFQFLELKKNTGASELRARDLFYALWVPDLFMKRVEAGENWTLMCPHSCPGLDDVWGEEFDKLYTRYESEGRGTKTVPALKVWMAILEAQQESGTPYMLYKDSCNSKSNQQNLGTIKCSNLCCEIVEYSSKDEIANCLTADTMILTEHGLRPIIECDNVNVVVPFRDDIDLKRKEHLVNAQLVPQGVKHTLKFKCRGHKDITVTDNHKMLAVVGRDYNKKENHYAWKRADELSIGDRLCLGANAPLAAFDIDSIDMDFAVDGWIQGDGWNTIHKGSNGKMEQDRHNIGVCFGPKETFAKEAVLQKMNLWHDSVAACANTPVHLRTSVKHHVQENGVVMWQSSKLAFVSLLVERFGFKIATGPTKEIPDRIYKAAPREIAGFLSGLFSADGCVAKNIKQNDRKKPMFVTLSAASYKTLIQVQELLTAFGIHGRVSHGEVKSRGTFQGALTISGHTNLMRFYKYIGFVFCPEKQQLLLNALAEERILSKEVSEWTEITDIIDAGDQPTYDLALPEGHHFIANGKVVHNCNLASVCLNTCVRNPYTSEASFDFERLHEVVKVVTTNLNRVIDKTTYPMIEAERSNLRHRPIGIGVQGWADACIMMRIPFVSDEAKTLNKHVFETIYHAALERSMELAQIEGPYSSFETSPAAEGILQFDLWNVDPGTERYDWPKLKEQIKLHGLRNSLLLAPMPTASTAQILGNNEGTEPFTSNMYTRRVNAGEFQVINKHLVKELSALGMWNETLYKQILANNGSIQNIESIPIWLREVYRTVWEMKQRPLVDMAADRGAFICQSQSFNVFMDPVDNGKLSAMHFYGWRKGLKTGMYYLRTKAATEAIKFTVDNSAKRKKEGEEQEQEQKESQVAAMLQCSRENREACTACSA